MKLVITGALGHIGSRLIHSLRPSEFEEVVLVDNLSTQRYCSLFNLPAGIAWRFVEADIMDEKVDLGRLFAGAAAVVHLAAITDAAHSFEIEEQVEHVNYAGTDRVARACVEAGCPLVFVSTTSVYGVSDGIVNERCTPEQLKPQSPYAQSKLRAEHRLVELGQTSGLSFVIARFGTIFGVSKGMRFHTAVNKFIWQACTGQPLTIWRPAFNQRRPYLDVGDSVEAIRMIVSKRLFGNQVYNVVTDNVTVREIVEIIGHDIPDVRLELVDAPIMNLFSYQVDGSKFEALGFRSTGNLRAGIAETIAMLRPTDRERASGSRERPPQLRTDRLSLRAI